MDSVEALHANQEALSELSAQAILAQADEFDLDTWLKGRAVEVGRAPRGPWRAQPEARTQLSAPNDLLTRRPAPSLKLALAPVDVGWQVPAYLRFGAWYDCPPPDVHVALLHRWHEAYGAELAVLGGDTIELLVARPPGAREEALTLVRTVYCYAPDSIDQGFESLDALAASLMASRAWLFWWDSVFGKLPRPPRHLLLTVATYLTGKTGARQPRVVRRATCDGLRE